jgi:hypothetical protein
MQKIATCTLCDATRGIAVAVSLLHGWGHDRKGMRASVARAHAGVSIKGLNDEIRVNRRTCGAAFTALPVEVWRTAES